MTICDRSLDAKSGHHVYKVDGSGRCGSRDRKPQVQCDLRFVTVFRCPSDRKQGQICGHSVQRADYGRGLIEAGAGGAAETRWTLLIGNHFAAAMTKCDRSLESESGHGGCKVEESG